jgi:hypothetical protein
VNKYTKNLMDLGVQYINKLEESEVVCAFAGGSVGRDEADEYSDLDLNIYLSGSKSSKSKNMIYQGQVIQVHTHSSPTLKKILNDPWRYRFLKEARVIYDPQEYFLNLKEGALNFFTSSSGRKLMLQQAMEEVQARKDWFKESFNKRLLYTSSVAAMSVWVEAAFIYSYFKHQSLGTGNLLKIMEKTHYHSVFKDCFDSDQIDVMELLNKLITYRKYLQIDSPKKFALDPEQDLLISRKVERMLKEKDFLNIQWLLQSEAFWCFMSIRDGLTLDQHLYSLPDSVRHSLTDHFFTCLDNKAMEDLIYTSDMILEELR